MMRKLSYGLILLSCLLLIGLTDFVLAGFNKEVLTRPSFWFSIIVSGFANYLMLVYTAVEKIDGALIKDEEVKTKKKELEQRNMEMKQLQKAFNPEHKACVIVHGEVYPGTTIVIGDVSTNIQSSYKYCRFEKIAGDVKMAAL